MDPAFVRPGLSFIPDAYADVVTKAIVTPAVKRKTHQAPNPEVSVQIPVLLLLLITSVSWGKF